MLRCIFERDQTEFIEVMNLCKDKMKIKDWRFRGIGSFKDPTGATVKAVLVHSNAEIWSKVQERKKGKTVQTNLNIKMNHEMEAFGAWEERVPDDGYVNSLKELRTNYRRSTSKGIPLITVRVCTAGEWDYDQRYTFCTYLIMFCRGYQPDLFATHRKSHSYFYILTKKLGSMVVCCEPGFEKELSKVLKCL